MAADRVLFVKAEDARLVDLTTTPVRADEPTKSQAIAGNYAKRAIPWRGLTIRIENETGSVRRGATWEITMRYPYGYIQRTGGVDGDEVDVYLGPFLETATMAFVVHQRKAGDWKAYDEDKVMLGFLTEDDAREAYLQQYDDPRFLGPITAMPVEEFVEKAKATKLAPKMIKAIPQRVLFLKAKPDTVTEPRADLIHEHRRLIRVLESGSHEDDEEEAKRQSKELKEYEAGGDAPMVKAIRQTT